MKALDREEDILKLKHGESLLLHEHQDGSIEVIKLHTYYFVFEVPCGGGHSIFQGYWDDIMVDDMIKTIDSWT